MATEFPGCEFLGVDVALLQPTKVLPQNCSFELVNILKGECEYIIYITPSFNMWFRYS
jgi:hypothetical protein